MEGRFRVSPKLIKWLSRLLQIFFLQPSEILLQRSGAFHGPFLSRFADPWLQYSYEKASNACLAIC